MPDAVRNVPAVNPIDRAREPRPRTASCRWRHHPSAPRTDPHRDAGCKARAFALCHLRGPACHYRDIGGGLSPIDTAPRSVKPAPAKCVRRADAVGLLGWMSMSFHTASAANTCRSCVGLDHALHSTQLQLPQPLSQALDWPGGGRHLLVPRTFHQ